MDTELTDLLAHPPFWVLAMVAFVGACIGSFLTMATYRLPRDEPIGMTRSRCPGCLKNLGMRDLIPIISWVASAARCRHCQAKVSIRYPLTELACAAGAVFCVLYYGATLEALTLAGLWWCIVAIIVTDLEHYIILDEVQIAAALLGVAHGYANHTAWEDMLFSAGLGAALGLTLKYGFLYLRNIDGLGLGDVKFLAVAGIWLANAASFVPFLFFSGVLGIISGMGWRMAGKGDRFPFGPALAAALFICSAFPFITNMFWQGYGLLLLGSTGQNNG